jgi:hypothetical protein
MQAPDPERVSLDYRSYRLAFRDVGRNTDERTVIACLLPPDRFCPHTVSLEQVFFDEVTPKGHQSVRRLNTTERLFVLAIFNSIVFDWFIRQSVTAHVSFFFVYNTPAPRLAADSKQALALVNRAARLTCTTSEFDALAREVGLEHHQPLDPMDRARLRAELDGLVAHLYGLSEAEFAHILASFPLVPEPVKVDAHNAYRRVAQGLIT